MFGLLEFAVIVGVVMLTAMTVWWWSAAPGTAPALKKVDETPPVALLFRDGILHHATQPAKALLAMEPGAHFWDDMRDGLLARFPDFPNGPGTGPQGQATFHAMDDDGPEQVQIKWRGSLCWVSLLHRNEKIIAPSESALQDELQALRRVRDCARNPVWQEDSSGNISWYNKAYEALHRQVHGVAVDPQRSLFDDCDAKLPHRVSLSTGVGERPDWYHLSAVPADGVTVYHATCINAVAQAEEAQRNFVQTLAKTFAHLSIGLAIFDRDSRLTIFNPALIDLTGLPAHFLSAQPTMLSFFDQLRENRGMPEPKNYHTWREEIAGVIAAATDGRYQETWTLESGQTYSVKGRPHPDGATAFLIEDISAEMTLTRNFRAELEQGQLLLDTVEEAMVVFSPTGVLTFSNDAYRRMWDVDPDASFADIMIRDSIVVWKQRFGPSRVWKSISEFVTDFTDRQPWNIEVSAVDGAPLICHLLPLPSGSTLVQFRQGGKAYVPTTVKEMLVSAG